MRHTKHKVKLFGENNCKAARLTNEGAAASANLRPHIGWLFYLPLHEHLLDLNLWITRCCLVLILDTENSIAVEAKCTHSDPLGQSAEYSISLTRLRYSALLRPSLYSYDSSPRRHGNRSGRVLPSRRIMIIHQNRYASSTRLPEMLRSPNPDISKRPSKSSPSMSRCASILPPASSL